MRCFFLVSRVYLAEAGSFGDFHTTYAQMEKAIESMAAAAPDRVKIYDIGLTNEHRMRHSRTR